MSAPGDPSWPLSPRAARVLYAVLDAWQPPDAPVEQGPRAPDPVSRLVEPLSRDERSHLERALRWLEWSPRLLLHDRRGLAWLPRARRRAWLDRLLATGPPPFAACARRLHRLVSTGDDSNGDGPRCQVPGASPWGGRSTRSRRGSRA